MVHGVHGNTTSLGPAVALDGELMLRARSLEEGLVGTATASDDADHATGTAGNHLLGAGRELDAGLALIVVVADNSDVVARGTAERTTVANLLLHVRHHGTLGHGGEGKHVADGQGGVLAGVHELAGVHALVSDEGLGLQLVAVGVAELDAGQRSTTTRVVDDLLHDAADVAMALGEIEGSELSSANPSAVDGLEDATGTFTLIPDLERSEAISSSSPKQPHRQIVRRARRNDRNGSSCCTRRIIPIIDREQRVLTTRPILSSPVRLGS